MKYIFTPFACFLTISLSAQLKQGDWNIGTTTNAPMNLRLRTNGSGFNSWEFSVNPTLGYFLKDRWEIGGGPIVSFNHTRIKDQFSSTVYKSNGRALGVSLYSRYYLKKEGKLVPYITVNGSYQRFTAHSWGPSGKFSSYVNEWQVGAGGGVSWFITPKVALLGELTYQGQWGGGSGYNHGLDFKIGFQVFFNRKRGK